eukprot:SAG11_NODE_11324_length_768_cov_1.807175_1_plen_140_part_10
MVRVPVATACSLDKATFDKKYRATMPVVVTGIASQWGAISKWDPALLKEGVLGSTEVQPFVALDNRHFLDRIDSVERRTMLLSQVLSHVFEPVEEPAGLPVRRIRHRCGTTIDTTSTRIATTAASPLELIGGERGRIYLR